MASAAESTKSTLVKVVGVPFHKAPLTELGCQYKWYSTAEICMILERLNSVTFVGDDVAQAVYTGLNILLNQDLALGGLQRELLEPNQKHTCKCNGQFLNAECREKMITSSNDRGRKSEVDFTIASHYCGSMLQFWHQF